MQRIAREQRPKMIIAGASAYARIIEFEPFADVAREIGAKFVVDMAHFAGLVATGYHPSPVPHADAVTSTTHKTLRGPRGGLILCKEEHARTVDKAMFPGTQGGPLEHIIAAKAVAFKEALEPSFKDYCGQIVRNAQALANALIELGFNLVSGGTDNHLILVDLRNKNVTGKVAEKALDAAGITVNKNTVPKETQSPFVTSGIRIGTPALTTLEMCQAQLTVRRHITGIELANSCRELALERYGVMARVVLEHWGICATADIGDIVFCLVDLGFLLSQPQDTRDEFVDVFDFDLAFERDYPWNCAQQA